MMGQHLDELKAKSRAYDEEHFELVRLRARLAEVEAERDEALQDKSDVQVAFRKAARCYQEAAAERDALAEKLRRVAEHARHLKCDCPNDGRDEHWVACRVRAIRMEVRTDDG